MPPIQRRNFLRVAACSSLCLTAGQGLLPTLQAQTQAPRTPKKPTIVTFTKSFQDRSIPEVCRLFKSLGLDGLDLTVRRGGHIDPKNVVTELPQAVKAAREQGLRIPMLTTGITEADSDAERLLQTAGELGITRVKLGYYRYSEFGTLAKQMDNVRKQIAGIAKLAARYNVLPCVHIHSGKYIPSHGTMLYELIRDFSPTEVGAYVDTLHMVLEGGSAGWKQGLDLLAPWIALAAVKNFRFEKGKRDKAGQQEWHTRVVPIADGISPLPEFIGTLKQIGFDGIYSLHSEYKGSHSYKELTTDGCTQQTATDLKYFRSLL